MDQNRILLFGTQERISPPPVGLRCGDRIADPRLATGPVFGDRLTPDQYLTDEMNVDRLRSEAMVLSMRTSTILKNATLTPKRRRTAEAIHQRASTELAKIYSPLRGTDLNNRANSFERARIRLDRIVKYSAAAKV